MAKKPKDRFDGFAVKLFLDSDVALVELAIAWELLKDSCQEDGDPVPVAPARRSYSGQFNARIDRRAQRARAIEAARAGITLHALVANKLARAAAIDDADT